MGLTRFVISQFYHIVIKNREYYVNFYRIREPSIRAGNSCDIVHKTAKGNVI